MSEKLPISDVKAFISALAFASNSIAGILDDGKVDFKDIGKLPSLIADLKAFSEVQYANVLPQIADLSPEEAAELSAHFSQIFDIKADSLELIIEQGLELTVQAFQAIQLLKDLFAKIKGKADA